MKKKIHAVWTGDGANGSGLLSSQSGAFENMPYSFKTRFENEDGKLGTNPEELIAAALAGCFNIENQVLFLMNPILALKKYLQTPHYYLNIL